MAILLDFKDFFYSLTRASAAQRVLARALKTKPIRKPSPMSECDPALAAAGCKMLEVPYLL
jgi:hypothetical protein